MSTAATKAEKKPAKKPCRYAQFVILNLMSNGSEWSPPEIAKTCKFPPSSMTNYLGSPDPDKRADREVYLKYTSLLGHGALRYGFRETENSGEEGIYLITAKGRQLLEKARAYFDKHPPGKRSKTRTVTKVLREAEAS